MIKERVILSISFFAGFLIQLTEILLDVGRETCFVFSSPFIRDNTSNIVKGTICLYCCLRKAGEWKDQFQIRSAIITTKLHGFLVNKQKQKYAVEGRL